MVAWLTITGIWGQTLAGWPQNIKVNQLIARFPISSRQGVDCDLTMRLTVLGQARILPVKVSIAI
jgi:hypothetical protein